jgi:hypothetical protein
MVGTDAIREGVNLHLFCDRVIHGLAWTAGDLEQRVGRVDRYFSLIEPRPKTASASMPTPDMLYPHLVNTVERRQIDILMQKKKLSDAVTDDGFSNVYGRGDTTFSLSASLPLDTRRIRSRNASSASDGIYGSSASGGRFCHVCIESKRDRICPSRDHARRESDGPRIEPDVSRMETNLT